MMTGRYLGFAPAFAAAALVTAAAAHANGPSQVAEPIRIAQADAAAPADTGEAKAKHAKPKSKRKPSPSDAGAAPAATASPAPPAAAPSTAQANPPPESAAPSAPLFQPVLHAAGAKVGTCMPLIQGASASLIDTAHDAVSAFSNTEPDGNLFQSIIALKYSNAQAPNAAAVIVAAPVAGNKCEGSLVRIYPTTQACGDIQTELMKNGKLLATLQATPVVETANRVRHMLLSTASGGCVVVAVGLR